MMDWLGHASMSQTSCARTYHGLVHLIDIDRLDRPELTPVFRCPEQESRLSERLCPILAFWSDQFGGSHLFQPATVGFFGVSTMEATCNELDDRSTERVEVESGEVRGSLRCETRC